MNHQLFEVGANTEAVAAERLISVGERYAELIGDVDQAVFDIGGGELVEARVERVYGVDLGMLELLRVEPIANPAVALALAGIDSGRVDHIGDVGQAAGGGLQPIQVGKRRRAHPQDGSERVDFAQAENPTVDGHGPRNQLEFGLRDSGHGVDPFCVWDRRSGACRLMPGGGNFGRGGEKPYEKSGAAGLASNGRPPCADPDRRLITPWSARARAQRDRARAGRPA